jgi:hypothetical protein
VVFKEFDRMGIRVITELFEIQYIHNIIKLLQI